MGWYLFCCIVRTIAFGKAKKAAYPRKHLGIGIMETGPAERCYGRNMSTQQYSRSSQKDPFLQPWLSTRFVQSARTAEVMDLIPADVEYRGNRIVWDTRQLPGTPFWTGRAAVVLPPDATGVKRIYRIPDSDPFETEQAVRDHLIGAAKDLIDQSIEIDSSMDLS